MVLRNLEQMGKLFLQWRDVCRRITRIEWAFPIGLWQPVSPIHYERILETLPALRWATNSFIQVGILETADAAIH
jgi:hypothetical protein